MKLQEAREHPVERKINQAYDRNKIEYERDYKMDDFLRRTGLDAKEFHNWALKIHDWLTDEIPLDYSPKIGTIGKTVSFGDPADI